MEEKEIKCRECGKMFKAKPNSRFKRKYCDKCSKERKEYYENIHLVKFEDCED